MGLFRTSGRRCTHCNGTGRVGYTEAGHQVQTRDGRTVAHTHHHGTVTCLPCNGTGTGTE